MSARVDVSDLPRLHTGREAPIWWGMAGLVVIDATVVASFVTSYFYLRLYHGEWPPSGVAPPALLWPTTGLVLLLVSCVTVTWAERALRRDARGRFLAGMIGSLVLAVLVLAIRGREFAELGFRWDSHPYGSIVWTMSGFHAVQLVIATTGIAVLTLLGLRGFLTARRRIAVAAYSLYWYFIALVWIPMYLVLYWAPRWL